MKFLQFSNYCDFRAKTAPNLGGKQRKMRAFLTAAQSELRVDGLRTGVRIQYLERRVVDKALELS